MSDEIVTAPPWPFPWPKPRSSYDTNGPKKTTEVDYKGHRFRVVPGKGEGIHTGRGRFLVACLTCGEVLHEATTGPTQHMDMHLSRVGS